jgi:hypothetical protein
MRRILVVASFAIAMLATSGLAQAHVSAHAARMHRVAHLKARVAALAVSATTQVADAAAQGPAAIAQLVQQVDAMPMPAPDTTSPQQYALLQALAPYASSTSQEVDTTASGATSADSCWFQGGHLSNRTSYFEGGVKVAWDEKDHGFWCGNGNSITQNGLPGYYRQQWITSPSSFCLVDVNTTNGWDAPNHAWAHGILTSHFGTYTPWTSCATFMGASVVIRINAKGGHDNYNDF